MEFGIGKCAILIMKSEKKKTRKITGLLNTESIKTLREKEIYNHLEILETNKMKENKIRKQYHRRTRKLLEKMLCIK